MKFLYSSSQNKENLIFLKLQDEIIDKEAKSHEKIYWRFFSKENRLMNELKQAKIPDRVIYINYHLLQPFMASKNFNKTVENYMLEELKFINPDGSELWEARHKILKKKFMLKRFGIKFTVNDQLKLKTLGMQIQDWIYQNIYREMELLKRHSGQFLPKCHRIIKTVNSFYLVYEPFPGKPLMKFLQEEKCNREEKQYVLLQIIKQVEYFHNLGIVFLNLSTENIHIFNKNQVFIRDWSLARFTEGKQLVGFEILGYQQDKLAQETGKGGHNFASDIFNLGKIFEKVLSHQSIRQIHNEHNDDLFSHELIAKMTQFRAKNRPCLKEIINVLEKSTAKSEKIILKHTPFSLKSFKCMEFSSSKKDLNSFSKNDSTEEDEFVNSNQNHNENDTTFMKKNPIQPLSGFKPFTLAGYMSTKNLRTGGDFNRTLSTIRLNQHSQKDINTRKNKTVVLQQSKHNFLKSACQKRGLTFFILTLAEYVIEIGQGTELAYILTKYARLNLKNIIEEVKSKYQSNLSKQVNQFLQILKKEYLGIVSAEKTIKKCFNLEEASSALTRELENERHISEQFLNSKIIEFGQQMMKFCELQIQNKLDIQKLQEYFLKINLILKKIQYGSYEKYWNSLNDSQQFFSSKEHTLKNQYKFSYRELKNKINLTLREKCGSQ